MFTEDLSVFFSTADFAVAATYNGATAVSVIMDNAFLADLGIASTSPVAMARASDIPAASFKGKTLLVSGTTYKITSREPMDDGAIVLLQLERQG